VNSIVVHYQEIALKGKNRPWFLGRLVRNLRHAVSDLPGVIVRPTMGRIELLIGQTPSKAATSSGAATEAARSTSSSRSVAAAPAVTTDAVIERIRHTFGIANFAVARRTGLDLDEMATAILADLGDRQCSSFRVSARRADKRFPMTSPEIEREVGGRIKEARGWHVKLSRPELEIHLDVLTHDAFYYFDKERGPGGLPTGTAGRVTCLLSGGIDSPVAAHRMMKRGCTVTFVHFHSYPILSIASQQKARELVRLLTTWQQRSRLYLVAFGEIQQQVLLSVPGPMRVVVYRRLMLRIAEKIARRRESQALVTGDVVGQVASQTLENLSVVGHVATLPLFRPLIGMDKDEIIAQAEKLGSYPISIIPDQDCCTLFTPRNPLTRARLADIEAAEQALPIEELVDKAVAEASSEDFDFPIKTRDRSREVMA
jgi:tRNA uracil 4-sulfurtransferase